MNGRIVSTIGAAEYPEFIVAAKRVAALVKYRNAQAMTSGRSVDYKALERAAPQVYRAVVKLPAAGELWLRFSGAGWPRAMLNPSPRLLERAEAYMQKFIADYELRLGDRIENVDGCGSLHVVKPSRSTNHVKFQRMYPREYKQFVIVRPPRQPGNGQIYSRD